MTEETDRARAELKRLKSVFDAAAAKETMNEPFKVFSRLAERADNFLATENTPAALRELGRLEQLCYEPDHLKRVREVQDILSPKPKR
ncbi:MAG TPA: hypothetical protein VEF76_09755 [Patescibacteria group bacterium]|nr:hypothetical protein [Patescibacteria group bacterium]